MDTKKLQLYFFIGLLFCVFILTLALFRPFIAPMALAFMLAILVRPVNKKFLHFFKDQRTYAAVATLIFVLVVILVPLTVMIQQVTLESYNFYRELRQDGGIDELASYIIEPIQSFFPGFDPDVRGTIGAFTDNVVSNASKIFSTTASAGLGVFVAIIALFYMLRDGHRFKKALIELSPLADAYDNEIIIRIERAVNSVVKGSLFTSLIKGILASIGFMIFGVPHPFLWGTLTAVVSLLPGIGAGLTLIPAILFLIAKDALGPAIGLGIWGFFAVGLVDNILMPIIVGKGFTVHPILVLLSVLGGIMFFGPIGLFLGPLVIALFSALVEIYKLIILDDAKKKITNI